MGSKVKTGRDKNCAQHAEVLKLCFVTSRVEIQNVESHIAMVYELKNEDPVIFIKQYSVLIFF